MTGNQLIQEIRRVLRCLSVIHACAKFSYAHVYEVLQAKPNRPSRHLSKVDASLLQEMEGRGLVLMEVGGNRETFMDVIGRKYLNETPENAPAFFITDQGRAFLARYDDEGNAQHAAQHRHLVDDKIVIDGRIVPVVRNAAESPLAWLRSRDRSRNWLSDEEYQAAERLRQDFTVAGLTPSLTADWSKPINRGTFTPGNNLNDTNLDARKRFNDAIRFIGPDLSDIAVNTCCFLIGFEGFEKARNWPTRSAKVVLRIALRRLAEHYGMINVQVKQGQAAE
jgi:hypothetical protein